MCEHHAGSEQLTVSTLKPSIVQKTMGCRLALFDLVERCSHSCWPNRADRFIWGARIVDIRRPDDTSFLLLSESREALQELPVASCSCMVADMFFNSPRY